MSSGIATGRHIHDATGVKEAVVKALEEKFARAPAHRQFPEAAMAADVLATYADRADQVCEAVAGSFNEDDVCHRRHRVCPLDIECCFL